MHSPEIMEKEHILDNLATILRNNSYKVIKKEPKDFIIREDDSLINLHDYIAAVYNYSCKGLFQLNKELNNVGELIQRLEEDEWFLLKRRHIGRKTHDKIIHALIELNLY